MIDDAHVAIAAEELAQAEEEALIVVAQQVNQNLGNGHVQHPVQNQAQIVFAEPTLAVWIRQQYMAYFVSYLSVVYTLNVCLNPMVICSLTKDFNVKNPNDFNSYFYYGTLVGVFFSMAFENKRSRLLVISVCLHISLIGWIYMLGSTAFSEVLTGRFLMGMGTGWHTVYIYYYLYEIILVDKNFLRNYALMSTPTGFFGITLLVVLASTFLHWRISIILGILLHIQAFRISKNLPESPYLMMYHELPRTLVQREFAELVRDNTPFAYLCFRRMESNIVQSHLMDKIFAKEYIWPTLRLAPLFVFSELCGISIYYGYMMVISGAQEFYGRFILCVITFIFFYISKLLSCYMLYFTSSKDSNILLINSSAFTMLCSLLLGSLYMMEAHKINDLVEIMIMIILQFYFLAYSNGMICIHNVLFNVPQPYYITMRMIAPLILCKFLAAYYLTVTFIPTDRALGERSLDFAINSLLGLVYTYFYNLARV